MQITISIIGDEALKLLTPSGSIFLPNLPKHFNEMPIEWHFHAQKDEINLEDLLMSEDHPKVLLIGMGKQLGDQDIRLAQAKIFSFLKQNPGNAYLYTPLIGVFEKEPKPALVHDIYDLFSDWVLTSSAPQDIASRIIFALAKKNIFENQPKEFEVTFSLASRTISFNSLAMQLSPTEFALAQIFFDRINETIALQELMTFFQSLGGATSINNLRVVVFHLRMKLAELTHNYWVLSNIYRQGYVLRHG